MRGARRAARQKHFLSPSWPAEFTISLLSRKWTVQILSHLRQRTYRYSELRDRIPALSEKILTERLHEMEERGLVSRLTSHSGPIYGLTEMGLSLNRVFDALHEWGIRNSRTPDD